MICIRSDKRNRLNNPLLYLQQRPEPKKYRDILAGVEQRKWESILVCRLFCAAAEQALVPAGT
jgi:hypothetical protein